MSAIGGVVPGRLKECQIGGRTAQESVHTATSINWRLNEDGPNEMAVMWDQTKQDVENFLEDAGAFVRTSATGPLEDDICFVHVPKCAGSSVDAAIRRKYRSVWDQDGRSLHKLDPRASDRSAEAMDATMWEVRRSTVGYFLGQKETRFASGHFQINERFLDKFADDYHFITMLRHPVDRWISHYWFNRYKDPSQDFYIEKEIESFLETDRARGIGQIFLAYFSGTGDMGPGERAASEAVYEEAKQNLARFDLVAFVEQMEAFNQSFADQFGTRLNLSRRNVSPATDEEKQVSPAVRERIRELCREDIELYEMAREKFGVD